MGSLLGRKNNKKTVVFLHDVYFNSISILKYLLIFSFFFFSYKEYFTPRLMEMFKSSILHNPKMLSLLLLYSGSERKDTRGNGVIVPSRFPLPFYYEWLVSHLMSTC